MVKRSVYRIVFVRPCLQRKQAGSGEHTAALVLWHHLFERCIRHPELALDAPDTGALVVHEGTFVPRAASGTAPPGAFEQERRDEVLWLEGALDVAGTLQLHGLRSGGRHETWSVLGGPEALGERIDRVLGLWLAARGLAPLSGTCAFSSAELLGFAERIEPALALRAKERSVLDPSNDDGAGQAEDPASADETEGEPPKADARCLPELPMAPLALRIAALRALAVCTDAAVSDLILAVDESNPWALLDAFRAGQRHGADYRLLRRAIDQAPGWGKLYQSLNIPESLGRIDLPDGPSPFEELAATGFSMLCSPADTEGRAAYGARLACAQRHEEQVRLHERTRDERYYSPRAWLPLLSAHKGLEAVGRWRGLAGRAANTVGLVVGGQIRPWNPWSMSVDLHASNGLLAAGLLGEAIVLRANRLEGLESRYRRAMAVLEDWRKDPRHVAWAFAREGYFRGEDARVLEGFSRAAPQDGVDLGMFMESLVVCGRAPEALLAWAQFGCGRDLATPFSRLSAVRAFLATGRFTEAFAERLRLQLEAPRRPYAAAIDRLGRTLALAPSGELESFVETQLERGAHTLARIAAREVADFVPGASASSAVMRALGKRPAAVFDSHWLAPFGRVPSQVAIDALFDQAAASARAATSPAALQAAADTLVERWPDVRFEQVVADDREGLAKATAYLFAQALGRYLAETTGVPSVLAGALRTVANEALLALGSLCRELTDDDLRALLRSLEPTSFVDPWLVDTWLLRIEHTLRLDERTHGRLGTLTSDAPGVATYLRGPEGIALESFEAARLLREKPAGYGKEARPLLERLLRSAGTSAAAPWAEAAVAGSRDDADAIDVAMTAAWLSEGSSAVASVLAARLLFARGRGELALEVLCSGFGAWGSEAWRDEQLGTLAPLWNAAGLDVPFEFGEGAREGIAALQQSDGARGARILRWLCALDPNNPEGQRNLGLAYAMQGQVEPALTHLARATSEEDTQIAAGVLFQSGHSDKALTVLDYASRWYDRAEQWVNFGAIVFQLMDNPRTVLAYANGWELDPEAFDASNLNSYAGVLDEVGDYTACERVARRLIESAAGDPMWSSNGWHHLACAFIGQGKLDEALSCAERAIAENPLPDNEQVFSETLERARTGARPPVPPPLPPPVPRHDAFVDLEAGDIQKVCDRYAGDASYPARLAVLRASRFRFGSDNYVPVTAAAKEAALRLVANTNGATELEAALCRELALTVREQAMFPSDPPPMLGDRGTREAFYQEFRARGGIIVGGPPVEGVPFVDREVCPGTALPKASDYAAVLRALTESTPAEALARFDIDEDAFTQAAEAWGRALRHDSGLGEMLASYCCGPAAVS